LQYRSWFQMAADAGVNLGVIRGMKEKWGKTGVNRQTGQPTYGSLGEEVPRGMKEVPELVQVTLKHFWTEEEGFAVQIGEKCRLNSDLIGKRFADLDFLELAMKLYPETAGTPEVWIE
jgi:hypothetical protein